MEVGRKVKHPQNPTNHTPTSNVIFNLAQMGIALGDAYHIEIDTYFELIDIFSENLDKTGNAPRMATQADIDNFLL